MNPWIDKDEYPFHSNYLTVPAGRLHYLDEGKGPPILMVHGNPTWSFLYRHFIKALSENYRCIAVDHMGFGLSEKPQEWSYLPEDHAGNLALLINHLDLKDLILVVQDWGGPIGLSYAIDNPENVRALIVMNTMMWSVKGDPHAERFSKFMGGPIGKFLIRRFNFFARVVMKQAMGDKSKLTKSIHRQYLMPLAKSAERKGCWIFPKEIIGSSDWLDSLWSQREKIRHKPALIAWGMKDIAFREKELNIWTDLLTNCQVIKYDDAGHFLQEEKGKELGPIIEDFISSHC